MYSVLCLLLAATAPVARSEQPVVEVYFPFVGGEKMTLAVQRARLVVNQIYDEIGVRVVWRAKAAAAKSGCSQQGLRWSIVVTFGTTVPPGIHAEAFAFSNPYSTEGPCVTLLMDQIEPAVRKNPFSAGYLLGCILAHERGHMLQKIAGHSETGVMKPHWSLADLMNAPKEGIHFTAHDAELIRRGFVSQTAAEAGAGEKTSTQQSKKEYGISGKGPDQGRRRTVQPRFIATGDQYRRSI